MSWFVFFVAFSLATALLAMAALRRSVKTSAFTLPVLNAGDRLISVFVVSTFTVASLYGLSLLATKLLP